MITKRAMAAAANSLKGLFANSAKIAAQYKAGKVGATINVRKPMRFSTAQNPNSWDDDGFGPWFIFSPPFYLPTTQESQMIVLLNEARAEIAAQLDGLRRAA